MWNELIWNVDFLRGLIFLVIGILAAVLLVPWIVKSVQAEREKRLSKALMRRWSHTCMFAITGLKLDEQISVRPSFESSESGNWDVKGYESAGQTIFNLWIDIRSGKRKPDKATLIIIDALEQGLYRGKVSKATEMEGEKKNSFKSSIEWIRSEVKVVLNTMYAKIEIFDVELIPIRELEMAMSYLDLFSEKGSFTMPQFLSYAFNLAESMEKFEKYLWKLENWSRKS